MLRLILLTVLLTSTVRVEAFNTPNKIFGVNGVTGIATLPLTSKSIRPLNKFKLCMSRDDGVLELLDDDEEILQSQKDKGSGAAPFLSQGEISEEALNPDLSDPKQTRVIIYIILSLVPVLFLIPLMLGSRDLIPLDALPPVEM
uniref:ER membrane protein complex subunit 10 n=1 Tax=Chaetoceros debilis TaxID=122233 RepID=A0A7S3V508_9STRA